MFALKPKHISSKLSELVWITLSLRSQLSHPQTRLLTACAPSLQVRPNCKTVPNGKITTPAKQKAAGLGKKSSAEEKERAKEREKEERSEKKEEKKEEETSEESRAEEQAFLVALYKYMKERDTPIERIPFLGFKQSE